MKQTKIESASTFIEGRGCCGPSSEASASPQSCGKSYRIPTTDRVNEERDIRCGLAAVLGIRGLRFQLFQKALNIDA